MVGSKRRSPRVQKYAPSRPQCCPPRALAVHTTHRIHTLSARKRTVQSTARAPCAVNGPAHVRCACAKSRAMCTAEQTTPCKCERQHKAEGRESAQVWRRRALPCATCCPHLIRYSWHLSARQACLSDMFRALHCPSHATRCIACHSNSA